MQLDILFINHSAQKENYQALADNYTAIETPTWSLLLAQSCRAKGFSVAILDCDAERLTYEQAVERIKYLNPRLACFTVYGQNPNSGTTNLEGATNVAERLRHESDVKIMFIGTHASALPYDVLGWDYTDFISINEGVYTLHALLQTDLKTDLDKVPGLGYKTYEYENYQLPKENLHLVPGKVVPQERLHIDLPGSAWDLLPYKNKPLDLYRAHFWHAKYQEEYRTPFAAIYTSLGCVKKCSFCVINIVNRTSIDNVDASHSNIMRFWSPEFIIKEFDKLVEYGVETLRISDELFFLNRRFYEPLLDLIIERGYGKFLNMWTYSRVDTVKEQYLEKFKNAGINTIALGIETANQVVRREVTKGSFEEVDIREVVDTLKKHDVNVGGNFIFGLPEDNIESMNETLDLAMELQCEMTNFYSCHALPGSPLYSQALADGIDLPKKFSEWAFLSYDCKTMPTKYLSAAEILRFRDEAWTKYHTNPQYLDLVERKFGLKARENMVKLSQIKLRRKICE